MRMRRLLLLSTAPAILVAIAACVGDEPAVDVPGNGDGGLQTGDGSPTGDGSTTPDGGGGDGGSGSCFPATGLAPGALDGTYSGTKRSTFHYTAFAAAIDALDRVVVVGQGDCENDAGANVPSYEALRFGADGTLDKTFGANGVTCVLMPATPNTSGGKAVTFDGSGRAIGVGSLIQGPPRGSVVRLTDNGAADTTFGAAGYVPFLGNVQSTYFAIAPFGDKILAAGSMGGVALVNRYGSDGTGDALFHSVGVSAAVGPNYFTSLATDPSGNFAFAGGKAGDVYVGQFPSTGPLDGDAGTPPMFATGGTNAVSTNIALRSDGALVGFVDHDTGANGVALVDTKGALVPSFGTGGIVHAPNTVALPATTTTSFAQQCDAKLVVLGGTVADAGSGQLTLSRFDSSGKLDTSFGTGGIAQLASSTTPLAVLPTSKGQLVVVSTYADASGTALQLFRFSM